MRQVKMRYVSPGLAPRRTKLEIPGWAGERTPRADGAQEQIWHCTPFSEGAQYGIEIFYPFDFELRAVTRGGKLFIEGEFGEPPSPTLEWPPFRSFGDLYYTHQVLLDLNPGEGYAIRTEPHPRFYSDTTRNLPDRRAGADPQLVADDVLHGLQVAAGRADAYLPPRRADGADPGDSGDGRVRSRRDDRRGAGRARTCARAASTPPARPSPPTRRGARRPTPCSTAPIATWRAPPRPRRRRPGAQ